MKRFFISLLNIIAIIPVVLIIITAPIVFIMTFDSPTSGNSTQMWIVRILMYVVIPLAVAGCIFLSQWKRSIIWALIAASPALYFGFEYFLKPSPLLTQYTEGKKDFICQTGYLTLKEKGFGTPNPDMQWVNWNQKIGMNSADSDAIGALYNGYFIPMEELEYIKAKGFSQSIFSKNKNMIQGCKNTENKTLFEIYPLGSESIIQELNEKINTRNKNTPL